MIERVIFKKKLFAIIIRAKFKKIGINFFTKPNNSLQSGYINYKKNHLITPHYHPKQKKIIYDTNEVLLIKKGIIKINFFDTKNLEKILKSKILYKGDIVHILNGGHGFKVLKDVEMIEIKQGPYNFKKAKYRLKDK
jgi:hypothetical protein